MLFSEINPFIRNARFIHIDRQTDYRRVYSYDARFFYVFDGQGDFFADNKSYSLSCGDAIIVNSGIEYQMVNPKQKIVYISFNFDYTSKHSSITYPAPPQLKENYDKSGIIEHVLFSDMPMFNRVVCVHGIQKASHKILSIQKEFDRKLLYHSIKEGNLFSEILVEIARTVNSVGQQNGKNPIGNTANVDAIIDYVNQFYFKNLSYEEIGERFSMHPNYINALVKARTGVSLHKYILNIRISNALEMLESGSYSVSQVASKCGFGDIQHFSHAFKATTGKSPSNYK